MAIEGRQVVGSNTG